ncbi:alpha/beta-hydrolase [Armillaria novae-zelandiae]|uniref:Alpha/beta-hydrolase n=1 Tax=Armillaria novae-zelandiae TaxID=153914 RepID=A0AA39UG97_9AGAR|nr:alpha/beta-hydrolase [Armillaria novae-zelandiae]
MNPPFNRLTIKIPSAESNTFLDVWLYTPPGPGPFPVVVAGHGLTLCKEAGMAVFGERWASEAGWASLILDYRGFGDSDGQRNLVIWKNQVEDYLSVISWARSSENQTRFLQDKIVVMGSAMSGLSVAEIITRDDVEGIAGGMAHSPLLDAKATLNSMTPNPRLMFWAVIDWVGSKLGFPPVFVPAVGKPDEFAFLNTPSCFPGFTAVYSKASKTFKQTPNLTCARLAFELFAARPGLKLKDLKCPMLVVMAEEDDINPPDITRNIVGKALGKVELVLSPGGHFDVMEGGKGYETNINAQTAFLKKLME